MCRFMLIVFMTFGFGTVCLTTDVSQKYTAELKPLPEEGNYKASGTGYKKGGMEPLFDFARSFIRTSLPGELPIDFIKTITRGDFSVGGLLLQVQSNIGFGLAVCIGVLFIIVFPIVGCCFCCCRRCGKCGAKNDLEIPGRAKCHRLVFTSALLVVATFALVGNICTYVSNERMTTGLEEINSNAANSLDDINTFLNLTEEQVKVLGPENLNITWKAVISTMDTTSLSNTLSNYIIETLSGGALATMEANIQKADRVFAEVKDAISGFRAISGLCTSCNSLEPQFALITGKETAFNSFKSTDINKKIKDEIASQVKNRLSTANLPVLKTDVDNQFKTMYEQFSKVVTKIQDFRQNTQSGFNVDSYKSKLNEYSGIALKYNNYRWIFGSVLSAILTLVNSLLILGVIFGIFGNTSLSLPISRGCVSHTGSRLLMVSVVFIFIFSSLLMLLTTVSFAFGALLERYVCQGLDGPNYPLLKVFDDQSFLTSMGIKATISDVVRSCKEGKTAYVAFQLENSTTMGFNMKQIQNDITQNKQTINNRLQTTLQSLTSLDPSTMHLKDQLHLLDDLVTSLTGLNFVPIKTQLNSMKTTIGNTLNVALDHFEALGNEVGGWRQSMTNSIENAQRQLSVQRMQQLVTSFSQDVFGIVDRYIDFAFDGLNNKLGKCTPLWNMYNSILLVSFCKYTIDAFNGFWFSIGWCLFFFMPGIILAVKLEKHFRRMNSVGPLDDSHSPESVIEMKHNA